MHGFREKQAELQVIFDQWSQNLLAGCCYSPDAIKSHLKGRQTWPTPFSCGSSGEKKSTAQKVFPQLMMANAFPGLGKLLPRAGQHVKSTNASKARQQMPLGSCQQVFYLPSYFREGHCLKSPTVALTFSLGQVGPSSTSRLASCHESSDGRCEIAGDLLVFGTLVLSFWAFDSL